MRKPDIKEFNVIGPPDHSEDLLKAIWSAGWSSVPEANGACATRDERAATHHNIAQSFFFVVVANFGKNFGLGPARLSKKY